MKSFKDLTSSLQLEAKATYCGRCGTVHVPPSQGGTCPALKKEEASPMVKPPKNEFGKKEDAFAHAKQYGGKVMKKTFTHPTSGMKTSSYVVVKEETELNEASFMSTMKKAIAAHERGDHKMAKYHLDNAKTARYTMKSTEIAKHKDLLDKYKELRDMHEETEIEEAHQVVAKTKEGETFRSAKYPTKKQAMDMHYKMAKSNKYAKVDTVKVQEEVEQIDETYSFRRKTGRQWQGNNLGTSSAEHELHFQGSPTGITLDGSTFGYAVRHNGKRVKKAYNFKDAKDAAVDYHKSLNEEQQGDTMSSMEQYLAAIEGKADFRSGLEEKKLTPAEMKKREEVAKAIERENPDMPMGKKMAIATATAKKVAEEAEELDEISTAAKQNYINAAALDVARHGNMLGRAQVGKSKTAANVSGSKIDKRLKGIATATSKLTKEETEGMHYCAKHVYSERFGEGFVVEGSHAEPDEQGLIEWYDVDFGGTVRRVMTEKVKVMHAEYHNNHKRKMSEEDKPHTIPKTAKEKSLAALAEPKDKITHADVMVGRGVKKEDVDLDEGMGKTLAHAVGKVVKAVAPNWVEKQQRAEDEKIKAAKRVAMDKFTSIAQKDVKKEEVDLEKEQLDELSINKMMTYRSKATEKLGSEPAKDAKRKEGIRVSGEKVKAMLKKEEVEQIDELKKETLKSYMGKAAKENLANLVKPGEEAKAKAAKRFSGLQKASEKVASKEIAKEEVDLEEAMISYSDFMDKIKSHRKAGHKVVDDKYTSGKATFTTITPDGTGRKVTHTPQGHKMEVLGKMDGEDDGAAEVKPTEKRGRGRPAGSKSGARTQ